MSDKKEKKEPLSQEQIREFSVSKLIRLIRGLEKAYLLEQEKAKKLIGAVKILEAMAKGEFKMKK